MNLPDPAVPQLAEVFTIVADIAQPVAAGRGLGGERLHIPITGGVVHGPRLTGSILPGGSDWPLLRADGATQVEAQYTIMADDSTPILVRNNGLRISSPEVAARMRAGEILTPDAYYFRSAPTFDAPDGAHQWLRETLFVASLAPAGRQITIKVYAVR